MQGFLFFSVGLIIGSFLNAAVCRMRSGETMLGRSACRSCGHQIRWYDNIPLISFFLLRGRCRDCQGKISWEYPIVELLTGALFFLISIRFFSLEDPVSWKETLWLLTVSSCLLAVAAYDMKHMEIPMLPVWIAGVATVAFLLADFSPGSAFFGSRLADGLFGACAVGGFFFALVFISKETWMGWGDVWLGFLAGMTVGLPAALFMLTVSFAVGAAIGIVGIVSSGKSMKSQMPFAPFLVIGVLMALLFPAFFPTLSRLLII